MEHESFEDPETAALMNERFVPVKVDREERPDVDSVYMEAVQAMTGRGGWPMTVFLTPTGEPIFAGTYFPREDIHGMPSFRRVLDAVHDAWTTRRGEVLEQGRGLTNALGQVIPPATAIPGTAQLSRAYQQLAAGFDSISGGFGEAPKFPQEPILEFLLRAEDAAWAPRAADMLESTLSAMAAGGIYDQIGGGFARYATDRAWVIPHFEKMLYNNAQLARIYLRAWQTTGNDRFERVARDTIDYVLRDLTNDHGGFMAAEDADSEGVEGKFYAWSLGELADALADARRTDIAAFWFGITATGNFEGSNVLTARRTLDELTAEFAMSRDEAAAALEEIRTRLLEVRNRRVRPGLDDKVIVSWNGLMVRALAEAGAVMGRADYLAAARRNADFVLERLRRPDGRLLRSWSKGRADLPAYLEDYGAYALGLSALYEATGEIRWYEAAAALTRAIPSLFADADGILYATGSDAESLIVRPRDQMDNPAPSGSSLAAEAYLRLGLYTGDTTWLSRFEQVLLASGRLVDRAPSAVGHLLAVMTSYENGIREVAIVGPNADTMADVVWSSYRPHLVLAIDRDGSDEARVPLLAGRYRPGETLAYVCEQMVCRAPLSATSDLNIALNLGPT